nr:secreted acidic protein 2-like [Procambarus clarkii]
MSTVDSNDDGDDGDDERSSISEGDNADPLSSANNDVDDDGDDVDGNESGAGYHIIIIDHTSDLRLGSHTDHESTVASSSNSNEDADRCEGCDEYSTSSEEEEENVLDPVNNDGFPIRGEVQTVTLEEVDTLVDFWADELEGKIAQYLERKIPFRNYGRGYGPSHL